MASKPINPQPLQMPDLSQLPDPMKDLMGGTGLTNPISMMTVSQQGINDLFAPKPIDGNLIKPSAEAAKVLQTAQQQAQAQADEVAKLQQRQLEIIEKQKQEAERRAQENMKLAEQMRKEREKAVKEKKEQQGGKLGAAPDGSFVLTADINKILRSQEWNSIVSDKQRTDQAEAYLAQYATQLKEMGATDEQIAGEIENGRGIFNAHTGAYRQGMMKDKSPIRDTVVEFAGGAGSLVTMVGGGVAKLIGADTVGDYLLDRNERVQSAVKDIVSNKVKLQSANKDYESEKYRQQYNVNPEIDLFDITGSSAAVKLAYQNGTLDSLITEQLPNILTSLGIGGAGKILAGKFASTQIASKLPTATKILTGNLKTGSRVIDKLVLPAASGSGLALGGYGTLSTVSDAGAGAWQTVRDTDFDTIKKVYGESTWATAVREHGSEEAAREALADEAFNRAAGKVAPVAVATSFLGVEATIAGMMTRQAVKDEAKKLTAKGVLKGIGSTALSAAEEGFEEGYTQYASNVGAKPYTGIATDSGVSDAIGIGALMGGGTTAVTNALSAYATEASKLPPKDFAASFVEQGYFSDKELRQNFALHMDYFNKRYTKDNDTSVNDIQHWKQTYFNDYIDTIHTVTRTDGTEDTKSVWDLMTPEQVQSFKDYVRLNYGINTNDYARHQDTIEYDAIKNDNMDVLTRPENDDLLNVWRILNNTDTDQIPADNRDYYMALADTTIQLRPTETTHNTHEREQLFGEFQQTDLVKRGLTDEQVAGVIQFARNILSANSRRFTDEEQQAWNAQQQGQSYDTSEQDQTDDGQSDGQEQTDENAKPVAKENVRNATSQATTLRQAAEELANAFSRRPASPDTQSTGDGNPRQGFDTSSQTDTPTADGARINQPDAGVGQTPTTGDTVNPTATEIHSGTPPQSGDTRQADQSGQPTGQTDTPATQETASGGSVGVTQTERNSNDGSNQPPTKASIEKSLFENGADISDTDIQSIVNSLPANLKKSLAYLELRDNVTIPSDKALSDYSVAQALAAMSNEVFNKTFVPALGVKSMRIGRGKTIRGTYNAIIKSYANLLYDRQAAQYRIEQDAQRLAMREQNAQMRAKEQARIQQEREVQKAQTDRIKAQQKAQREAAKEQQKIDDADIANAKAQQVLRDKQENLHVKEGIHTELNDSRNELIRQLNEAKLAQKEGKQVVRDYEKQVKNANTAVDKADKAWRKELEKVKRKELKERWTVEKNAANTVKNELTKAIKALEVADKSVNDLNKKIQALDVKIKKAKQAVTVADREVVLSRTTADKTQAVLDALQSIQADEKLAPDTTDNDLQDVDEADVANTVDENPQTAEDVETIEQAEELVEEAEREQDQAKIEQLEKRRRFQRSAVFDAVNDVQAILDSTDYSQVEKILANSYALSSSLYPKMWTRLQDYINRRFAQTNQQETTNVKENDLGQSVQPTQERNRDENTPDTVGDDNTANEQSREVPRQSRKTVRKQSQASNEQTGLGVVATNSPAPVVSSVVNLNNNVYPIEYRIISADELSANVSQESNVSRNRSNQVSQDQIDNIAANPIPSQLISTSTGMDGSPILANDGNILSGNGRTLGMQKMYETNQAGVEAYQDTLKKWLSIFGFTEEQYNSVDKPIFVRMLKVPLSQTEQNNFALSANTAETLGISPLETAKSDQFHLDKVKGLAFLEVKENGDINSEKNSNIFNQFIATLPIAEQANLRSAGGSFNPELLTRFKNALLVRAYGSNGIVKDMLDTTDSDLLNIRNALMRSAPTVAVFKTETANRTDRELDLSDDIMSAIEYIKTAKVSQGGKLSTAIDNYFKTSDFFNPAPAIVQSLARYFATNINSVAKLSELLNTYYDAVSKVDVNQSAFIDNPTKVEQYNGALEVVKASDFAVDEQSQASGAETTQLGVENSNETLDTPTYYTDNLTAKEINAVKEIADNEGVDIGAVYQAIADGNIRFFSGRGDSQGASLDVMAKELANQEVATNVATARDFIARLTTPPVQQEIQQATPKAKTGRMLIWDYLNTNPSEHATIRAYFNEQQALAQRAVDDNADNLTDDIVSNYNLFNGTEIDFIEKMLGDKPFTDDNISQVIANTRTIHTAGGTFANLPATIQGIIRKVWDKIKSTAVAISMALAITTGTTLTIPTDANAATPNQTAVVQNIIEQNDNQGKRFIVADKQAGTLTMYTASGQQITTTPALFGKTKGDSVSSKNTPSGRFETKHVNVRSKGYGGTAQALTQNGHNLQLDGTTYAIHRVYTRYASENRQGRLDTPTATDNRISHGCINVPVDFYDTYLAGDQDTVVYVMPETDAGKVGVFNVGAANTKEQVDPTYDNANVQSVEVTPEQIANATPYDQVKVAPKRIPTPLTVKGAEQSTQIAYTTPTVLGGANGTVPITADRIVTPKIDGKVIHTPAEYRADTSFDTEPVMDKTDDGISLAQVAIGLAGAFAGGMYINRRRERAKAKKLESKKRTPLADNPPDTTPNMPQDPPTTEQVQDTVDAGHNEQVNKSANNAKTIPTDIKVPSQPTPAALAVNRELWINYLIKSNQLGYTGSEEMADMLRNTLRAFEYSNLAIMTDRTYQQANDGTFADHRWWGDGEVDTDRIGIYNKFINIAAGATPVFDNFMGKLGIVRGGHEADSSLASIALAQVKAKTLGANAQIYKFYVKPMEERTKLLAQELRRSDDEVELATGRVATAKHILNEAADAMWRGFEAELAHLQDSLDKVNADLASTPPNKDYPLRMMNTAKKLEDEIQEVSKLYVRTRNMYEGKMAWDAETKLPGGMTKARAEQDIAEVKAEYGVDYSKIEENAKELTKAIRGIRQFATAAGVFTNADIEVFNELGFDDYVPLYAEDKDPTDMNEEDNYTQSSAMDRIMQGIPLTQARSLGLTKDLSRYRRKGAKSPAADGFTNMKKFALNMSGRVGQQNWVEMTQQLYEGTVGKPYSTANITDPDTLADLNASYDSGKVPGLIRVRPGMKDFLPADVKARIDKVRPIIGKGANANGDTVAFEYYWTEPAIQAEIYANTDLSDTLTADYLRSIGTATRAAARLVTVGKPVWSVYNFVRDSFERVSVMLMRPVKDQSGNLVPKWKLATEFFRALPTIVLNSRDIYRYLVIGEVKTPLQIILNEAAGEGSINLMTALTEKHSVISELKKSQLEKAGKKISKWLGDTANKTGAGGARNTLTKGLDFYIVAMTEVPQVATALASYMAYQNVGVNKKESANRVRDAYDPNRTNNKIIHNIGQVHPFVRSNFSGHYNLSRSLTQYWRPGEWQFTLAYTLGGTLGVIGLLSMMAGMFDDDDDGRSALARLPLSTLMGGLPVPWGENGVWTLPVGFGMNKFIWGIGANFYRYINGYQGAGETAMGLAGLLVDNTSPIQATGGSSLAENPTAAAVLTATPMLLKPIVETGFNVKAYGGGKIWHRDTPQDQLNSEQDNFNTPETYKKWARWLNENGFGDYRPESLRHLFESYGNLAGPFSAIPQSVIADQSEKTLGNKERKGEVFGAVLTAIGAGMSIQPNALDIANLTYEMDSRRYELHRKYGVGKSHTDEQYEQYAQRGEGGGVIKDAKYVTEVRLRGKGVPEEHIQYIINGMEYQSRREKLDKEFKDLALEYNRLVASGKEDLQMRQSVQNAWDALESLTDDYVKENNDVFFTLR